MTDGGVSLSVDGHADRDQLAALLRRYWYENGMTPDQIADAILKSDFVRAARRAALLEAADEVHKEARWWLEHHRKGIQVVDPIGRWLTVEKILRARARARAEAGNDV